MYRLGFPVSVRGIALRAHDSRRWQNNPHLSVSLAYLRDIIRHLESIDVRFYRLSGQLAPYATHPQLPQFHHQVEECSVELAAIGDLARQANLRLTIHPAHYIQLGSPRPQQVERSAAELALAARLLDAMGQDDNSVVVIHVGGAYGDPAATRARFVETLLALPLATRRRIALENDDRQFSLDDTLWIHRRTGIRLVLDVLHHRCLNPSNRPLPDALTAALQTWPPDQTPKIHFSSPRTELRYLHRDGAARLQMPLPNQHSDCIQPFEFIEFVRSAIKHNRRAFDIMLEAKAKELALLRLREQVARYAPDLAPHIR